jgi:sugar lactone lactonase YvrE
MVLVVCLLALLTACPRPLVPPASTPGLGTAPGLSATEQVLGQVDFGAQKVQADISDDIAPGATVALIDVLSGQTLSTTRTDENGRFVLVYSNGFKPVSGGLYYFEALKGLKGASGVPNAVGADVVRVRTIASYRSGGWVTLTSRGVTTSILINPMSTALSVIVSLRQGSAAPLDVSTLFGAIKPGRAQGSYPDTLDLPDPSLVPLVQSAYDLVIDALAKERDPVRWITLDSENPNVVRLPDVPFSIKFPDPGVQEIGKELDLVGVNFAPQPEQNLVSFRTDGGWVPATVVSVLPDLTRLKVIVPDGAVNGPIRLQIGDKILISDFNFQLAVVDGHSVVRPFGGITYLFVANASLGTIAYVSPSGEATPLITNLSSPQALTFGPDGFLYVACGGTKKRVVRFDVTLDGNGKLVPGTPTDYSGLLSNPSGMAFDLSDPNPDPSQRVYPLYVADRGLNQLHRVEWTANRNTAQPTALFPVAGLNEPRGLSFGADGRLYVANAGANNVLAVSKLSGESDTYLSGLGKPWSVAFDSKGNFYVSSNTGNSIFRRDAVSGVLSAFASVPSPGGLDADASGYIYCGDNLSNQIYLVNSLGETRMVATGISSPMGIHVDADGIFVVTGSGQLLKITHDTGSLSVLADGLTGAGDLGRDAAGNFYVFQKSLGRISRITPAGIISVFLNVTNTSDIYVKGNKLYLKKTNTLRPDGNWSGMGGVEVRDLSDREVVEDLKLSYLRDAAGMAFDTTPAGTYRDWLYVANLDDRSVVRLKPEGDGDLKKHKVHRFLDRFNAPELDRPWDVWVDPANGNVWVSDQGTSTADDGLYVYNSAGTRIADYSGIVDRPLKFGYDGSRLYLANYGGHEVIRIDPTNGTELGAIAVSFPRSLAFDAATNRMFIGTWDGNHSTNRPIKKVESYPTASVVTDYYNLLAYDLVFENGNLYTAAGSTYKIAADLTRHDRFMSSRSTLYDFARRADGKIYHITRDGRLGRWTTDWDGEIASMVEYAGGGPLVVDGLGNWISAFMTGCSTKDILMGRLDDSDPASFQITPIRFSTDDCWVPDANMASDGGNLVFITANPKAELVRFNTATYAFHDLGRRFGMTDRSHGVSVYNGKVYQTIMTRHQIDVYDANGASGGEGSNPPAYLETLPVGLVAPEL